MFKIYIIIYVSLLTQNLSAQSKVTDSAHLKRPEIFNAGFIDVVNNGQVNASARLIRLYVGEKGKFVIPLSFYGGVSSNNFQNQTSNGQLVKSNDHLVNQYINPLSGLINVSVEDIKYFKKSEVLTKIGFLYQAGARVLNGIRVGPINNPQTGKSINFLNDFATCGLYLKTGAWDKLDEKNTGTFWIAVRYHLCYTNPRQIREFLPTVETNGIYTGYSIGFGIEINNLVSMKAIYYKYSKAPEIEYGLPIYQFSFNYAMK